MTFDIPPLRPPEDTPPIKTQDDLCRFWRMLMGELGFSQRYLWAVILDSQGAVLPQVFQIAQCPAKPDRLMLRNLMQAFRTVFDDDTDAYSVALLWSRPGKAATSNQDIDWANTIREAARGALVPIWPVHLANDFDLRVFAPDELAA